MNGISFRAAIRTTSPAILMALVFAFAAPLVVGSAENPNISQALSRLIDQEIEAKLAARNLAA